jgi:hypothetical protein
VGHKEFEMNELSLRDLNLIQSGDIFEFRGDQWVGFKSLRIPDEMEKLPEGTPWRFLRLDGKTYSRGEIPPVGDENLWARSRFGTACVVGYWYEGIELPGPKLKPVEGVAKFIKDGITWTCCDGAEMPAELAGCKAYEWAYFTKQDLQVNKPVIAAFPPNWGHGKGYWGVADRYRMVAYRIIGDVHDDVKPVVKRVKHKSPGCLVYEAKKEEEQAKAEETKANFAMIVRDGPSESAVDKHNRLVKAMIGNGNIFAPMKREVPNLSRVTPITVTGHVLWGNGD